MTKSKKSLQIVFLGAGYDTRAIWYQHLIKNTFICGLDAPTTQLEKKKCF